MNKTVTTLENIINNSQIPLNETEIILAFILQKDRSFIYAFPETNLTKLQSNLFNNFRERRLKNEPLAYILGYKEFYGLNFKTDKRALIPRHDTEDIVNETLKKIKKSRPVIADIGTGSGCIAISIAANHPTAKIYATDISSSALNLAKENIKLHKMTKRIKLLKGNLLTPIKEPLDLIVANLPYIASDKIKNLEFQVRDYEPKIALDGGYDGMQLYQKLFRQAKNLLKPSGIIFYEVNGKIIKLSADDLAETLRE